MSTQQQKQLYRSCETIIQTLKASVCSLHARLAYVFLDEGDVHERRVGVDELEHERLSDQVILVGRVRPVVFLDKKPWAIFSIQEHTS